MFAGLSLRLFGGFEARRGEQSLTGFESDKARALLAYLATMPGTALRREAICALLWPELSEKDARHNLSQVLSSVRTLLGDRNAAIPVLLADRQSVWLNDKAAMQVDVQVFAELLARCRKHQHAQAQNCPSCAEWRREAASYYCGDFLQGLSINAAPEFDNWATLQRERWHRQAMDSFRWLADYHECRGELLEAETFSRRQIALEPWREEAQLQLMRLLAHAGQRTAALVQYELCRQVLADTFNVAPESETTAFYQRLQRAERGRLTLVPNLAAAFVGRQQELAELSALLAQPDRRLVTVVGPGGSGKTRLALALAQRVEARFLDGVAAIYLADVDSAGHIITALVTALGLPFGEGDAPARVKDYLREKEALLVLDNCEHLPSVSEIAGELLAAAPGLKILATSRHRLRHALETRYPLGGLPHGAPADGTASSADALHLFEQAARRVQPDFVLHEGNAEDVMRICRLVDGLPLALEMAAAWVRVMSCAAIGAEIERSNGFLMASDAGVPARHRSMLAVWNHSWKLLTPAERVALRRLTVFRGGFTRGALATVTGASLAVISGLLDKSLLERFDDRYVVHELVRQFAADKWDSQAEALQTAERHCDYYLTMIAEREEALWKGVGGDVRQTLVRELDNIRQAWRHAARRGRLETLTAAAGALSAFFRLEGLVAEGEEAFALAAAHVGAGALLVRLLTYQARFLLDLGRTGEAEKAAERALLLAEEAGDLPASAAAWMALGQVLELRGQYDAAAEQYERARLHYDRQKDERGIAEAQSGLGNVHWHLSDYAAALDHFHAALALDRKLENQRGVIRHLINLGIVYWERSEFTQALAQLEEAMNLSTAMGHREQVARAAHNIGLIYWRLGRRRQAMAFYEQAATIASDLGLRRGIVVTHTNIGILERERGRYTEALSHYRRAISVAREIGFSYGLAMVLGNVGNLYRDMGQYERAWPYYEEALALDEAAGNREGVGRHWGEMGRWHARQWQEAAACDYLQRAVARLRDLGSTYNLSSLLPELAGVLLRQGCVTEAENVSSEGLQLAAAVGRQEAQVQAAIVAAQIAQLRGDIVAARALLHAMLESAKEAELEAALTYALWEITGEPEPGHRAWALYQELAAATPKAAYRERRDALRAALSLST